ncbi:ribosome 60S biogenesis N-terminal-domain-containing protein [Gongronella butleri]|nr:ribosome 60S biogenesis N-terminal-domain-containing protein [Gongronella butleri]
MVQPEASKGDTTSTFYTSVSDVSQAFKVKELSVLVKDLKVVRAQLQHCVALVVDPMEKYTRPLVEYVQSLADPSSLVGLWDYQSSTNIQDLECIVPDVMSLVLRLCETPILRAFGSDLAQSLLSRHLKSIYRGIASSRVPQCMSCFRVLIALASFNATIASELFQLFNFQAEGFSRAARYRQARKGKNPHQYLYDLRTMYVRFVLAFFSHGDTYVKKQLIGTKNVVQFVFNHLDEDPYLFVQEILQVFKDKLILDHHVPRHVKLAVFTPSNLSKLADLYDRRDEEAISATETGVVAELVHEFLLSICTVPDVGVCFRSPGWYPAETDKTKGHASASNSCLAKFILSLQPSDDMRQQALLLGILRVCPELIAGYWQHVPLTYEPRLSTKWLGNMAFMQKVVQQPAASFYFRDTQAYPTMPPSADLLLAHILPRPFARATSVKALQHAHPLVRYMACHLLAASFQKFDAMTRQMHQVITTLRGVEVDAAANVMKMDIDDEDDEDEAKERPSQAWQRALDTLREQFRRALPEIPVLTLQHAALFNGPPDAKDDTEIATQRRLLKIAIVRLLDYYQTHVPIAFMESAIDPSNLIPSNLLDLSPSVLVHLLRFLFHLPDFQWSSKTSGKSVSHITTLITLYLRTPHQLIRELTGQLVAKTLADSHMFRHDPEEALLWLQALPSALTAVEGQEALLRFLDACFLRFGKGEYRYIERAVEVFCAASAPLDENALVRPLLWHAEDASSNNEPSYPVSPLLFVLLEQLPYLQANQAVIVDYLCQLLLLLHAKQKVPHYIHAIFAQLQAVLKVQPETDVAQAPCFDIPQLLAQVGQCIGVIHPDDDTPMDIIDDTAIAPLLAVDPNGSQAQQQWHDQLQKTPATATMGQWATLASKCASLGFSAYDPLVAYISRRFPAAGSLFAYEQTLGDDDNDLRKLLAAVPFPVLFHNAVRAGPSSAEALSVLCDSLAGASSHSVRCAVHLCMQELTVLFLGDTPKRATLDLCLGVLQHVVGLVNEENDEKESHLTADDAIAIKELIFGHPVLKDIDARIDTLLHAPDQLDKNAIDWLQVVLQFMDLFADGARGDSLLARVVSVAPSELDDRVFRVLMTVVKTLLARSAVPSSVVELLSCDALVGRCTAEELLALLCLPVEGDKQARAAQKSLLDACCTDVVHAMAQGRALPVDMGLLADVCLAKNVDVGGIVQSYADVDVSAPWIDVVRVASGLPLTKADDLLHWALQHVLNKLNGATFLPQDTVIDALTSLIDHLADKIDWDRVDKELVRDYVLNTLLDHLDNAAALRWTNAMVKHVYANYTRMEPIETYIRRILDHDQYASLCKPVDLRALEATEEEDEEDEGEDATFKALEDVPIESATRQALTTLLATLNTIQPQVLAKNHGLLDRLLISYSATTLESDRCILAMLESCEKHSEKSILGKMLIWGPGSDEARQSHAQSGRLFDETTVSMETLAAIDRKRMRRTLLAVPSSTSNASSASSASSSAITYDPAFFLPLFANLVSAGRLDSRRFIEVDGLGLVIASLSSLDTRVRSIAYQVMDQFYAQLEVARFKGLLPVRFLLDALKNAIVDRAEADVPPRLPPAVCLCVAQCCSILLLPNHFLLPHIAKWVTFRPALDMNYIPMYTALFHSSSRSSKQERQWLLELLAASVHNLDDYRMYSRHRVWDQVASFYQSVLADDQARALIRTMTLQAIQLPAIALRLIQHNGLVVWIQQVLTMTQRRSEKENIQWRLILTQLFSVIRESDLPDRVAAMLTHQITLLETILNQ